MTISGTILDRIKDFYRGKVTENYPLASLTSYKIGGPAKVYVAPESEAEVLEILTFVNKNDLEYFILGKGSNLLINDSGFDGVIIHLAENYSGIEVQNNELVVKSGSKLLDVVRKAAAEGLSGTEQLAGIPGTVGGALRMNAGAFGQEIEAITKWVKVIDQNNNIRKIARDQINFGYRSAPELEKMLILESCFGFEKEEVEVLNQRIEDILEIRNKKQPLEYPSCGSVFKRPVGYYAGALIEECGLKGTSFGGAQISPKHAGFIVNTGTAKASDVLALIKTIEESVLNKFGVALNREVKLLGFNEEA